MNFLINCTRRSLCGKYSGQGFDSPHLHQKKTVDSLEIYGLFLCTQFSTRFFVLVHLVLLQSRELRKRFAVETAAGYRNDAKLSCSSLLQRHEQPQIKPAVLGVGGQGAAMALGHGQQVFQAVVAAFGRFGAHRQAVFKPQ